MAMKTVEIKRKIISLIRNRESKEALKLFYKNFNEDSPAELEFIKNVFVELNRLELYKENFEFLAKIGIWYPDDIEFQEIFENATNTYVSNLILQANNTNFQRIEKERSLEDSLKRADSLTREKMQIENSKQLLILNEKSKDLYKLALKYSPNNITALRGLLECCKISGDEKEIEEVEQKIENLIPKKVSINKTDNEININDNKDNENQKTSYIEYPEYLKLFEDGKFSELIDLVTKTESNSYFPSEALLLKARALVNLKRFKEADKTIFDAERQNTNYYSLKETKDEINNIKLALYQKAGSFFLKQGINLGFPLGKNNFLKAKFCFTKALEISPDDLDILDHTYSALKYLGEDDEAFKIKGTIYSIKPSYKTTYDLSFNQTLCFIATYTFYDHPWIIDEFRWFRREFLLNCLIGRRINSLYVTISSKITRVILKNEIIRNYFKIVLFIPLLFVELIKCFKAIKGDTLK